MDQTYSELIENLAEQIVHDLDTTNGIPGVRVLEVTTKSDMLRFIKLPQQLYKGDPNFVFEPIFLQKEFFSHKNPFFTHSSARFFLAEFNGVLVGRIASIINTIHNKTYNENIGFFGFFESINNYEVAKILLNIVIDIHRIAGFNRVIGPTNFTTNDSAGLLISGFDSPPVVMMPYNKPYYADFLKRYGFNNETDLSSYLMDDVILTSERFKNLADGITSKLSANGITLRNINYRSLNKELVSACSIYNESNKDNWGFIPLTEAEFVHTGNLFRQFVPQDLILLAVKANEIVGFAVALPDLNQIFRKIPSGKMLPFGFIKYLWHKKKISNSRILILGVEQSLRKSGIDVILYKKMQENLALHGIYSGEACYVMENNKAMNSILNKLGAKKVKEYRIYNYELTPKDIFAESYDNGDGDQA